MPAIVPNVWFPLNEQRTKLMLNHFTDQIIKIYEYSAIDWESVAALILRDFFFACPAHRVAQQLAKHATPTYLYHYTYKVPNWIDHWILGDYHSCELEVVFDNPWPPYIHYFDDADKSMPLLSVDTGPTSSTPPLRTSAQQKVY